MRYFKVKYEDGLQGKCHEVVVSAMSMVDAQVKVESRFAWQQPIVIKISEYKEHALVCNC